ncbi:hypothetical protein FOC1_g10014872 [Fusarium oxysporum f. sp. cubense race 1]|uniref:Uncharacterized protein n=1 Tax=Fusarium oxysporum f. sp. cubense (strain race 1) TaxID=1229664 RepID=N4TH77_FUSC1|nr:hypothetical protein FOC1_g10014872 [Fusarium oxysporum f. sp. cubense race 1]
MRTSTTQVFLHAIIMNSNGALSIIHVTKILIVAKKLLQAALNIRHLCVPCCTPPSFYVSAR